MVNKISKTTIMAEDRKTILLTDNTGAFVVSPHQPFVEKLTSRHIIAGE